MANQLCDWIRDISRGGAQVGRWLSFVTSCNSCYFGWRLKKLTTNGSASVGNSCPPGCM